MKSEFVVVPILMSAIVKISKNSPHTPTYSFLVSPCTYYFNHFSCIPLDSIYTIDIPPRVRNLHNRFLFAIPFKLLLLIYLSRFFGEIR